MNDAKPYIMTLIASAVAALGASIGLLGVITTPQATLGVMLVMAASIGLIFISYRELGIIEEDEKQEELDRQYEQHKVQLDILNELIAINRKTRNENFHGVEIYQQIEKDNREKRLLEALERIAASIDSPDIQRLTSPENEETEASDEDIPPEADTNETQSNNKNP